MPPMPPRRRRCAARPAPLSCWRPRTSRWARALPGVAYRLGGRVDTHATGLAVQQRRSRRDPLVLPPAHGSGADARAAAVVRAARCRLLRAVERRRRARRTVETVAVDAAADAHHRHRHARARSRRADHPSGRQAAVRGRRRLDQEAGRRRGPRGRSRAADPRISCAPPRPRWAAANRWWT